MAEGPRVRVVSLALAVVVCWSAGALARVWAQAAEDKRPSGIYLEAPSDAAPAEPTRLDGNMPTVAASVGVGAAFGFGKPKMTTTVSGDKASLRVAPASTFLFVFGERKSMRDMMSDPTAAMDRMNELPAHTSSPKDFALLRLAANEGDRVYDSKTGQQVKCAVEKLGPKLFRIKPEQALEPGEYAFAAMQSGVAGMVWDFGVDTAATSR